MTASRLVHVIGPLFLGLTPQAMSLPPLRGWVFLFHLCSWGSRPRLRICRRFAASWPQSMKIMATWWRLEPLCGFALSPHEDTVTRGTLVAASRLHISSQRECGISGAHATTSRLRGFFNDDVATLAHEPWSVGSGSAPDGGGGWAACPLGESRPAPKARQVFSLGREPQGSRQGAIGQAAKRRQIFSLGREPQETARPTPTSPEGATDMCPGV